MVVVIFVLVYSLVAGTFLDASSVDLHLYGFLFPLLNVIKGLALLLAAECLIASFKVLQQLRVNCNNTEMF